MQKTGEPSVSIANKDSGSFGDRTIRTQTTKNCACNGDKKRPSLFSSPTHGTASEKTPIIHRFPLTGRHSGTASERFSTPERSGGHRPVGPVLRPFHRLRNENRTVTSEQDVESAPCRNSEPFKIHTSVRVIRCWETRGKDRKTKPLKAKLEKSHRNDSVT